MYDVHYEPTILNFNNDVAHDMHLCKNDDFHIIGHPKKRHMGVTCMGNRVMVDMIALY